jgi:hypothetical protein
MGPHSFFRSEDAGTADRPPSSEGARQQQNGIRSSSVAESAIPVINAQAHGDDAGRRENGLP